MTEQTITFLHAVYAVHSTGAFMMSMPHNGRLTEQEFLDCYQEITGTDENDTVITTTNPDDFTVTYSDVAAKYDELMAE